MTEVMEMVNVDRNGRKRWPNYLSDFEVRFLIGRAEKYIERSGEESDREVLEEIKIQMSYRP